jgi:hypothetical protein
MNQCNTTEKVRKETAVKIQSVYKLERMGTDERSRWEIKADIQIMEHGQIIKRRHKKVS